MRKSSVLDALFTTPRQRILAATVMDPDRWWYLSDLARHLGVHHATLQRDLNRLVEAEILLRKRDGNRTYYRANSDSPVFSELRGLLTKTVGLVEELRIALRPFAKVIKVAFVHGSVASGTEGAESDIDLIVVGSIGLQALAPALREAEARLQRPINPSFFSENEFAGRAKSGSSFIQRVMAKDKLFILGTQRDLERVAQRQEDRNSRAVARRDRRSTPGR